MDSCSVVCSTSQTEEQQPSSRGGICSAELGRSAHTGVEMDSPGSESRLCDKDDAEHRDVHGPALEMTMTQAVWSFFHMSSRVYARAALKQLVKLGFGA